MRNMLTAVKTSIHSLISFRSDCHTGRALFCLSVAFCMFIILTGCGSTGDAREGAGKIALPETVGEPNLDVDWLNPKLARRVSGIKALNLGNALEAPVEGMWGITLEEDYFRAISKAGFNTVRVPIKWSNNAGKQEPYTIDESFFRRIDWVVKMCQKYKHLAILNMHHYDEIFEDTGDHEEYAENQIKSV